MPPYRLKPNSSQQPVAATEVTLAVDEVRAAPVAPSAEVSDRQPSRIGAEAIAARASTDVTSPAPRRRPADAPLEARDRTRRRGLSNERAEMTMTGSVTAPEEPARAWLAMLNRVSRPTRWGELAACREVLLAPAAPAPARRVGDGLAALQQTLMAVESSRAHFDEASQEVAAVIEASRLPEQAVLIAYADLCVLYEASKGRWPAVASLENADGSAGIA